MVNTQQRLARNDHQLVANAEMLKLMQRASHNVHLFKHPAKIVQNLTAANIVLNRNAMQYSTVPAQATPSPTNPQNLPMLPVPKLQDTLAKYLKTVEPHLTATEFAKTKALVEEFGQQGGVGQTLQQLLEKRAQYEENWLSDWWLSSAYLEYRDPVIVFSSPGLVYPLRKFQNENDRVHFAAKVISAALSYKRMVDQKQLKTEHMGKAPLDMAQYDKIFGTCRVPGKTSDSLIYNPNSRHITFVTKRTFFRIPVYGGPALDEILSEEQLINQIKICIKIARNTRRLEPIGVLTADNRDNWGEAYAELIKDPVNRRSVQTIQNSLFLVSIDDEIPTYTGDKTLTACYQLIHGGGSSGCAGNRWYDKTIQFIVGHNGVNGLTYEHSPAEGQPIAVLTDYLIEYIDKNKCDNTKEIQYIDTPIRLDFNLSDKSEKHIDRASQNVNRLVADLDMNYLHFTSYGKNFIKSQKMSPDSYIQMAIQYAFYRLHKVPGAHYESAQTRMYVHGRTETIRSCSNESIAFAKAMTENGSDADKVAALKAAVQVHKDYVSMAVQGYGVDRHLLGLKLTAKEHNIALPELYKDAGYTKSAHMRLSTSQVASNYEAFMVYGPLTNDGYGCCYSPRNDDMYFGISSFRSCAETDSERFRKTLEECLQHMFEVLTRAGTPIKSKL